MNRPSPLLWLGLLLLVLLPSAAGRVLLDLIGGLMLAVVAIPLVLTGLANDVGPRLELVLYALNRPIRTQDAVITTVAHQLARKPKKVVSDSQKPI